MSTSLLIVGSDREDYGINQRLAGRALLWGLKQHGIAWETYEPGAGPPPDVDSYDAVLTWSYMIYRLSPEYLPGARAIEAEARRHGVPVINSAEHCGAPHSFFLETWRRHGIPSARCQRYVDVDDIELDYPLLLRRDGVHRGQDLFRVESREEAQRLVRERDEAGQARLDLAIEFVDFRDRDGLYNRYRSWVVGDQIIPVSVLVSKHWLVNYGEFVDDELAERYGREFQEAGEPNVDQVLMAARLSGSDIVSLDYAKHADGRYIFWEANRHFLTLEDYGHEPSESFARATGVDAEGRQRTFEDLGTALGKLVLERANKESCE